MRFQDQVVKFTQRALDDVLRAVDAMPSESLEWTPAPTCRSTLKQMQELASSATWLLPILRDGSVPKLDDHARREQRLAVERFDSIEKCRAEIRRSTALLCQFISEFPDERLEHEVTLPFGGGQTMTLADAMMLHAWNLIYHFGQINYIQTALGDLEMH